MSAGIAPGLAPPEGLRAWRPGAITLSLAKGGRKEVNQVNALCDAPAAAHEQYGGGQRAAQAVKRGRPLHQLALVLE